MEAASPQFGIEAAHKLCEDEEFAQVDRSNTNSLKWLKYPKDTIPCWVADCDVAVEPKITEALVQRAQHPVYGYTVMPFSMKQLICQWAETRHAWKIEPSWLSYAPGVVPAFAIAIQALTVPGDKIAVLVPVYAPICRCVWESGRRVLRSVLQTHVLPNGRFTSEIDFADLEKKLADPKCKMLILCSPHNPSGRIWTRNELERLAALCSKYNTTVISDEIHWDLSLPESPHRHLPFASLSKDVSMRTITCTAPSKTFNIAGLAFAYIVAENPVLRAKWNNIVQSQLGIFPAPVFSLAGAEAAYRYGAPWLDRLCAHIQGNYKLLCQFLSQNHLLDDIRPSQMEATFLVWLDCRGFIERLHLKKLDHRDPALIDADHDDGWFADWLAQAARVGCSDGCEFGAEGDGFLRINIGCSRGTMQEILERIKHAVITAVPL